MSVSVRGVPPTRASTRADSTDQGKPGAEASVSTSVCNCRSAHWRARVAAARLAAARLRARVRSCRASSAAVIQPTCDVGAAVGGAFLGGAAGDAAIGHQFPLQTGNLQAERDDLGMFLGQISEQAQPAPGADFGAARPGSSAPHRRRPEEPGPSALFRRRQDFGWRRCGVLGELTLAQVVDPRADGIFGVAGRLQLGLESGELCLAGCFAALGDVMLGEVAGHAVDRELSVAGSRGDLLEHHVAAGRCRPQSTRTVMPAAAAFSHDRRPPDRVRRPTGRKAGPRSDSRERGRGGPPSPPETPPARRPAWHRSECRAVAGRSWTRGGDIPCPGAERADCARCAQQAAAPRIHHVWYRLGARCGLSCW